MKISLEWLGDHVDLHGLDGETIANKLTMATAEVEGLETKTRAVAGVKVGEVLAASPMGPDEGGTLKACEVVCGDHRFSTVCGAPEVRVGGLYAFAPAGVALADGVPIEAREVGGRRSEGVLCSPRELGIGELHEGLLCCPPGLRPGTALADLIPAKDVILEIDNKSLTHRPDLWGHYGFARELAAIFHRELAPLGQVDLAVFHDLPEYDIRIDDADGCPCYGCLELRAPGDRPAPITLQVRLLGLGQRAYNLLVDLTNYIMLELGQPTHAFDGACLRAVRVGPMGRAGTFVTLDGQERAMLPDDLMIWNEQEPVAIAGVMGGLRSEVTAATSTLLLESANFRGSRIRRTSVRLGLRSEASLRFEKGQPPVNVRVAVGRFVRLMQEAGADPRVSSRFSVVGDPDDGLRHLPVSRRFLDLKTGTPLPLETSLGILRRLGFTATETGDGDTLALGVPPHRSRKDISIPEDIVEEVLRIHGYDNVEPRMPEAPMRPVWVNLPMRAEHKARRLLAQAHGFTEVHTYSWFDDDWLKTLGFDPGPTLRLRNPSAPKLGRMRTTLVPNLLGLVAPNSMHRESFRLFELGRAYVPTAEGRDERSIVAGVSYSQQRDLSVEDHFRSVRGAVEDLCTMLGCSGSLELRPCEENGPSPWQQAGAWLNAVRDGRTLGGLGLILPPLAEAVGARGQVAWFELAMEGLCGPLFPEVAHRPSSPYPGSWHDFSIVWETGRGYATLCQILDGFTHPLEVRREFLVLYQGKGLEAGQGSYTFRSFLGSGDHTLTGDEIEAFRAAFLAFLADHGLALR